MRTFTIPAAILGAGLLAAGTASAQVVLTASSWLPPTHTLSTSQAKWCEAVGAATANRVRCNILPKAVVAPTATFDAVRDGLADLSFSVHGYTPGRYVMTQMAELPFLGDSSEATSIAYQRMFDKYLSKSNEMKGLKVLAVFTHGPGIVFNTKKPINSLADLQGLKFRVGGGMVNEIGKALGANVTLKPAPESYELLSSGVMDGTWFPAESVESFKIDKVIKHKTTFPGGLYNTSFAFVMNEGTWNKISKADQAAIEKVSGEAAARLFGRGWDSVDRRANAFMQTAGVTHTVASKAFVDEIRARTAPLEQKWIADAKAKGLPNAEQVLKEFRAEIAKN
ncbi:MAG: TRAP transporter substrate-binding protein [Burkholderiaceae bacterium]|jgi:TRAP-type C4-dicarboxylate transport system substrate-binding protein|nr:TRAP transporter substrate-binding protein [Burkholderiales bacterium]MCZ8104207.1 TRAP transporter substrate-binding protein [Burkholderiales bacterium]MCZ8341244.1 TRAP transporter substrate-binding protein [Burkholderiaceae bacterium]